MSRKWRKALFPEATFGSILRITFPRRDPVDLACGRSDPSSPAAPDDVITQVKQHAGGDRSHIGIVVHRKAAALRCIGIDGGFGRSLPNRVIVSGIAASSAHGRRMERSRLGTRELRMIRRTFCPLKTNYRLRRAAKASEGLRNVVLGKAGNAGATMDSRQFTAS